ncbi:urease accessory protein UreF [Streptosporangium sp. DT93]|uniref:urease accessory protein UreF n=1 Tax=Streptosporangium sp. DT93 TaxID=3393428 RepID=UPI003CE74BFF
MNAALLLLADSRLPAGGHGHSGGVEEAVRMGAIQDLVGLAAFLRGRLATAGLVTAALAAAACEYATHLVTLPPETAGLTPLPPEAARHTAGRSGTDHLGAAPLTTGSTGAAPRVPEDGAGWVRLDAEADARISSPAQREASRTQGRLLLRTSRRIWPSPLLDAQAGAVPQGVHHPLALGAVAAVAGCSPAEAALAAAYTSVTAPATAAVRLLGLDPVAVHRLLADLAPALERVAATVVTVPAVPGDPGNPTGSRDLGGPAVSPDSAGPGGSTGSGSSTGPGSLTGPGTSGGLTGWEALPAHAAPALDLLAERHIRADLRLFVS